MNATTSPAKKPFIVKSDKKELILGIIAGVLLFGVVLWAIGSMSSLVVDKGLTGTITAKHFAPQPEEQISVGKAGLRERTVDGEYTFEVSAGGKIYTVWVDKTVYDSYKTGDRFYFLRPAPSRP